jgi:hypothetical protein
MLPVRLHEGVTARSLALARVLIGAIWIGYLALDDIGALSHLPDELFRPYGVFQPLPEGVWAAALTPVGLGFVTAVVATAALWTTIGLPGARAVAAALVVAGLFYVELKKGFGGHWDHRELTLIYVTALLALTPAWDALTVGRRAGGRRPAATYRAALIALSLVVVVQYVFIGVARFAIGTPGVFVGGTLQTWIANRNLRPDPFGFEFGTWFLDPGWAVPLDLLFLAGTVLEVSALAVLFLRPGIVKVGLAFGFAAFHLAILGLMNVAFLENVVLLLLWFDLAAPLRSRFPERIAPTVLPDTVERGPFARWFLGDRRWRTFVPGRDRPRGVSR